MIVPHRMHCYHYGDICGKCSRKTKTKCSSCAGCLNHCPDYKKEECTLLKKLPYVCNGCGIKHMCTLEKHLYDAYTVRPERIRSNKNGVLFWLYLALILRKKSLHSLILCSVLFLKTDSLFTASWQTIWMLSCAVRRPSIPIYTAVCSKAEISTCPERYVSDPEEKICCV